MMEMAGSAGQALLGNVQEDHSIILGNASLEAPIAFTVPGPASIVLCHLTQASGSLELRTLGARGAPVRHISATVQSVAPAGKPQEHPAHSDCITLINKGMHAKTDQELMMCMPPVHAQCSECG